MTKTKNIVFCGYNVFPIGYAQTQRLLLIAKGLNENNCDCTVLCRYGTYTKNLINENESEEYDGVKYKYTSGSSLRPNSFFERNMLKIKGLIFELFYLFKLRITGKLNYMFVMTNTFDKVIYYSFLARILFIPSVIDNTEFWSSVKRNRIIIGAKLYDYLSPLLFTKVICISDFLYNHTRKTRDRINILKIPALVDFDKFNIPIIENESSLDDNDFILFCGSALYFPVIDFIIESFERIHDKNTALVIVSSNGNRIDFEKLNNRISNSTKKKLIRLKSNIKYTELVELYKKSTALLIPLRPTNEDTARFPHKLGEYTASKNVIITTNNGEIPNYFFDLENALVAESFDTKLFSEKIDYAIQNKNNLNSLKNNSYQTGLDNFDYKINGLKIYNFLFKN